MGIEAISGRTFGMTSILLFGKTGQVGWELQRSLSVLGRLTAIDIEECDLTDSEAIRTVIRQVQPNVIVNAAAYTAVDKAESNADIAQKVNSVAPTVMAVEAKTIGAWFIHFSTDYVFNGEKSGAYLENDETEPLSVYGRTKLEGEQGIIDSGANYLIFRTSWVYATRGQNFAKTMLKLAQEREQLRVVGDQFGAPTSAELLADVTANCLQKVLNANDAHLSGVYHVVASGVTTWFDYATYVIEYARSRHLPIMCLSDGIHSIITSDYPTPAKRPKNSVLDTQKIQETFGVSLPDWRYHLDRMLTELI